MASPYYFSLRGQLTLKGKKPDGDSVRFIADDPEGWEALRRNDRIRLSTVDASVQLRFEGVDAPELHYGSAAQPLGADARDVLLAEAGFREVVFADNDPTLVSDSTPATVEATVLAQAVEVNGRPIAYVVVGDDLPRDRTWVRVTRRLLGRTLNARLLTTGVAYLTVYTSTPTEHRRWLRAMALAARAEARGVWRRDETAEFRLTSLDDIGPDGQLILPKLFRRCVDYLKDVDKGYDGNLVDWILDVSATPTRDENDGVVVAGMQLRLSDLLLQRNQRIAFQADPLDVTFIEK